MPAGLAGFDQGIQHVDDRGAAHAGAGFGAFAQQEGEVTCGLGRAVVGCDGRGGGGGGHSGALTDQQGGNHAGVWIVARCEIERDPLAFLVGRLRRQGIEEGLLFRAAQRREVVQCGEGCGGKVSATGHTAGAAMIEHHAAAEQGGGDGNGVGQGAVLDDAADGVAFELDLHAAGQA